jgi:hypothetical protein
MITIHQPDFIPYLGFFNKARLCDVLVIGDHVQYSDKGYTNRVKIKSSNGANWLTVSNTHRFGQSINEIKISKERDEFWYEKHLKTLQFCYGKTKFFDDYIGKFESVYKKKYELLADLNLDFIKTVLEILGYDVPIKKTSEMNLTKSKNEGIIEICKNLGEDSYLSGMGGKRYIDESIFKQNDIKLFFNKYEHPTYNQQFMDLGFIQGLSILDLIFNEGTNSCSVLESGFQGF